ncbi:MAG: NAD(P)H-hydrate dehydratase [Clostridiales bacterium]|nr:NAD(P)H-hydrate dehydratase [Clostridiales bacterium]
MMQAPYLITETLLTGKCPARPAFGHKGTFGRTLICAGTPGMGGAAYMAASSALRSGTGLVYVLTEQELLTPLMTLCPEALGLAFPVKGKGASPELVASSEGSVSRPVAGKGNGPLIRNGNLVAGTAPFAKWFTRQLSEKDAVLIGPGIPPESERLGIMIRIAAEHAPHLVLDAGALSRLAADTETMQVVSLRPSRGLAPAILTPHIGEFSRFVPNYKKGDMRRPGTWAEENGFTLVLKSHETNIFTSDGKWYSNSVSNTGLAKGGSGDVLAGLLTGLLAQGMPEEEASVCAVGIHSLAGQLCAKEHGRRAMLPTMLWDYYDKCFAMLKWEEGME